MRTEAKDIEHFIPIALDQFRIKEVNEHPMAMEAFGYIWIGDHRVSDTTMLDFWNRPIRWMLPPDDRMDCILLTDSLYAKLDRYGLTANGVIHSFGGRAMRIGGTFSTLPYKNNRYMYAKCQVVELVNWHDEEVTEIIVQPKKGAYDRVFADLTTVMQRINPKPLELRVMNLRKSLDQDIVIYEVMQRASWILSGVCLIICLMGIWSTIALDTRSRQKEVALRKIHGAKRKDIVLLFGRLYLWLIGVATLVSTPLIVLFNTLLKDWVRSSIIGTIEEQLSPILPILGALIITTLVITLIVGLHLRTVMKVQSADMIAKE